MKIGRRLAIKILNASKFVLGRLDEPTSLGPSDVTTPLDRDLLALLGELSRPRRRTSFENYDYARALERTETLLLVVLRRLRRAGEGPRLRRGPTTPHALGARHARHRALGPPAPLRPVPALRHRRGVALVARRTRSTWPPGRPSTSSATARVDRRVDLRAGLRGRSRPSAARRAPPRSPSAPSVARLVVRGPEEFAGGPPRERRRPRCRGQR